MIRAVVQVMAVLLRAVQVLLQQQLIPDLLLEFPALPLEDRVEDGVGGDEAAADAERRGEHLPRDVLQRKFPRSAFHQRCGFQRFGGLFELEPLPGVAKAHHALRLHKIY